MNRTNTKYGRKCFKYELLGNFALLLVSLFVVVTLHHSSSTHFKHLRFIRSFLVFLFLFTSLLPLELPAIETELKVRL